MVYSWRNGARMSIDAQTAGEVCDSIQKRYGDVQPKVLLNESRAEDAPLHNAFEWNDGIAAEAYRESQARDIIRFLVATDVVEEQKEPVKVYFKVEEEKSYENITVIMSDDDKKQKLLEQAVKELMWFKKKYSVLNELSGVFSAIDNLKIEGF